MRCRCCGTATVLCSACDADEDAVLLFGPSAPFAAVPQCPQKHQPPQLRLGVSLRLNGPSLTRRGHGDVPRVELRKDGGVRPSCSFAGVEVRRKEVGWTCLVREHKGNSREGKAYLEERS
jgi:hypothetical protein